MRLEQLRARVEEENAKRTLALQAWQAELRAAGSALDLRHGPQAAAAQPALLRDAEDSWRALRKGSDMPEDVRDWIEVGCPQILHGFLQKHMRCCRTSCVLICGGRGAKVGGCENHDPPLRQ